MDFLGPIFVAFIVLVYYGLRIVFQPILKKAKLYTQEDFFNEREFTEKPTPTLYEDTERGFVFNDPLEEEEETLPPPKSHADTTQITKPEFFSKLQGISTRIQQEIRKSHASEDTDTAEYGESEDAPQSSFSTSQRPTSTPAEVSKAYHQDSPLSKKPSDSTVSKSSPDNYPLAHSLAKSTLLQQKLKSPHKKRFLREMILMQEILDKPVALRTRKHTL